MRYLLSLGSNIGDKIGALRGALRELEARGVQLLSCSSFYRTAPLDAPPQDDFVNIAAVVEGPDDPEKMWAAIVQIETLLGRRRERRNGPRTIDIDIILAEMGCYRSSTLEIPHPRWRGRRFVVEPAREAAAIFEPFAREIASVSDSLLREQRVEKMEDPS